MALTDEGLILVVVLTWVPLLVSHFIIVRRSKQLASASGVSEHTRNLVALTAFLLITALYVIVCTITMYAAMHDKQNLRPAITLGAEVVWLFSPLIATASVIPVRPTLLPWCFQIVPTTKRGWMLCVRRALVWGIPLALVFSIGDQLIRQAISLMVTGDVDSPIPVNKTYLYSIGETLGMSSPGGWVCATIGYVWNATLGPLVDLFAPASDSILEYDNAAGTGVALYALYAIPEEIGWTGTLYPLLLTQFAASTPTAALNQHWAMVKAMVLTGTFWGLWHCPFVVLKWNHAVGSIESFIYTVLFVISAIATRILLTSLVFPVFKANSLTATHLLDVANPIAGQNEFVNHPSLLPAILIHGATNNWWSFYTSLYNWRSVPTWTLYLGCEYSFYAVAWQLAIAALLIKKTMDAKPPAETQASLDGAAAISDSLNNAL